VDEVGGGRICCDVPLCELWLTNFRHLYDDRNLTSATSLMVRLIGRKLGRVYRYEKSCNYALERKRGFDSQGKAMLNTLTKNTSLLL